MAAKLDINNNNPNTPEPSCIRSISVPSMSDNGIRPIMISISTRKLMMPRYFPSTSCVVDSGDEKSRLIVPLRRSSLMMRMVIKGVTSNKIMPLIWNKPATTISVTPLPASQGVGFKNWFSRIKKNTASKNSTTARMIQASGDLNRRRHSCSAMTSIFIISG